MISLVFLMIVSQSLIQCYGMCDVGYHPWLRSCIKAVRTDSDHQQAVNYCKRNDGILLELWDEAAELNSLSTVLGNITAKEIWLGGVSEKIWYWSEDGQMRSTDAMISKGYWGGGEPNNNDASENRIQLIEPLKFKWNDEPENRRQHIDRLKFKALCTCQLNSTHCGKSNPLLLHNGTQYFIPPASGLNWAEAFKECNKHGGKLAKIESKEVQEFIENQKSLTTSMWMAGYWDGRYRLSWLKGNPISQDKSLWLSQTDRITQRLCVYAVKVPNGHVKLNSSTCDKRKQFICQNKKKAATILGDKGYLTSAPTTVTEPSPVRTSSFYVTDSSVPTTVTEPSSLRTSSFNVTESTNASHCIMFISAQSSSTFSSSKFAQTPTIPELTMPGAGLVLVGALGLSCGVNFLLCCLLAFIHLNRSREKRATTPLSVDRLLKEQAWT